MLWYNTNGDQMDRKNIGRIAQTEEDKILLAKAWDKIRNGMQRNTPANTGFLSLREQEMVRYLFGNDEGLHFFGGFEDAERKMLVYLPEYVVESSLRSENSPLMCLRADFFFGDTLTHRDFLGALMGSGIARDTIGDILVDNGCCDFFVMKEIAPYILQNFNSAGRTKLRLKTIPLSDLHVPSAETVQIKDTLASLRLDSVISSGFCISRSAAAQYVSAGRVAINGLACEKPDKSVDEGAFVSVRGLGKIQLRKIGGQTKKGRISVVIDRYV